MGEGLTDYHHLHNDCDALKGGVRSRIAEAEDKCSWRRNGLFEDPTANYDLAFQLHWDLIAGQEEDMKL